VFIAGIVMGKAWGSEVQSREEKFELKRQAVLRTAAALFRSKGVQNTALSDVADALNVSKPTVYYYFRNKDEVLLALIEGAVAQFGDGQAHPQDYPLAAGISNTARLERFLRRAMRILFDELGTHFPIWLPHLLEGDKRAQLLAIGSPVDGIAEKILREGIADGSFAPSNVIATYRFVIGALRYIPVWQKDHSLTPVEITEEFVSFVMRSVRPD
jgi:AcrR family transcriptional regulator